MKCIECGTNNRLSDRTKNLGFCKKCGHQFAFEPENMEGIQITDRFFADALSNISSEETLFFTSNQLLYSLNKRRKYGVYDLKDTGFPLTQIVIFVILFIALGIISDSSKPSFSLNILALALIAWIGTQISTFITSLTVTITNYNDRQRLQVTEAQLYSWIERWKFVGNSIDKLLDPPQLTAAATTISDEVSSYSFDRVIICDCATIAQLLIANNVHFENSCAILSLNGYPAAIFDTVMQMLRRNSDLKVYVLHDTTPQGISLIHTLKTSSEWFENQTIQYFELGLLPRQVIGKRQMIVNQSTTFAQEAGLLPESVRQSLSKAELEWLDRGYYVELESFSPRRIIRVVTQGIAQSLEPNNSDTLVEFEENNWGESSTYYADSFG
jgi:hypothetical protein